MILYEPAPLKFLIVPAPLTTENHAEKDLAAEQNQVPVYQKAASGFVPAVFTGKDSLLIPLLSLIYCIHTSIEFSVAGFKQQLSAIT